MTLFGILITAIAGAILVRRQGFKTINDARENLDKQKFPVEQVIHGTFILFAGILLLTPGFLTDTIGFLFLIPALRLAIAHKVWNWIKSNDAVNIHMTGTGDDRTHSSANSKSGSVIDGEAVEIDEHSDQPTPWRLPSK